MKTTLHIYLFFIILSIVSCTPQKRLNRLVKKHPKLIKVDTILDIDTFVTESVKVDTFLAYNYLVENDTVIVVKDKLRLQYVKIHDTLMIEAECLPDTIIKTEKIPYNKITVQDRLPQWAKTLLIVFGVFILLLFGAIIYIKRR
jgi:hypothetical protein